MQFCDLSYRHVDMAPKMKTTAAFLVHLRSFLKEVTRYAGATKIVRDFFELLS